jgi:hypothetical protein
VRDFSWDVFAATGNIEAYLLYRELSKRHEQQEERDVTEVVAT